MSFTISRNLLKLMSIESVMPSNHFILCRPLLLLSSIFPSNRVFSNESALCIGWPNYWSFSISPSNEYSVQISFRMDWFDLLGVQGTLKSLVQHHSLKVSIIQCSDFFIVQLLHPYMTTGKTIALTIWTFVGKVMWLYFINKYFFNSFSSCYLTQNGPTLMISSSRFPSLITTFVPSISSLHFYDQLFVLMTFRPSTPFSSFALASYAFFSSLNCILGCFHRKAATIVETLISYAS